MSIFWTLTALASAKCTYNVRELAAGVLRLAIAVDNIGTCAPHGHS